MLALLFGERRHRIAQSLVTDPVIGKSEHWLKASLYFVFSLCSGVKSRQTMIDAVLYAAVITGFKMQAVKLRQTAPIASVQRTLSLKKQCGRNRLVFD